ncbi:putative Protein OS-9 [Hypsibius exemplaris]|uniref:MRH domain-containing protein n=1 Tax=Hypsibius exemplaris TaxID=2072580 RepID=A0A9X6N9C6_HYPEX|nr:putative Protein OS-9 [Hypsibius exemplaris]
MELWKKCAPIFILLAAARCTGLERGGGGTAAGSFGDSGLYKVVIDKTRVPAATPPNDIFPPEIEGNVEKTVIMRNRKGQPFRCSIPDMVKPSDEKDKLVNLTTEAIEEALVPTESNRGCVNLITSGWWHYEFCFRKHVIQYHTEPSGVISKPVITLGIYSHSYNWSNVSAKDALKKKDRYHLQYFANGTTCDLTGEQRQTRVKIYCDGSNWMTDHVESVREPESCVYEVIIFSKRLCAFPYFRKEDPAIGQIRCNPVATSSVKSDHLQIDQGKAVEGNADSFSEATGPVPIVTMPELPTAATETVSDITMRGSGSVDDVRKPSLTTEDEVSDSFPVNVRGKIPFDPSEQTYEQFYERAQQFTRERKEVWVPDEMLFKILANVAANRQQFEDLNNREFIVLELMDRTTDLLKKKARSDSAAQRSLAFDLASQNIADATRILKKEGKNQPRPEFVLHYLPKVTLMQMYIEQFLSLYDLENTRPLATPPTATLDNGMVDDEELLQAIDPDTATQAEPKRVKPISYGEYLIVLNAEVRANDIHSLAPFTDGEQQMYDDFVAYMAFVMSNVHTVIGTGVTPAFDIIAVRERLKVILNWMLMDEILEDSERLIRRKFQSKMIQLAQSYDTFLEALLPLRPMPFPKKKPESLVNQNGPDPESEEFFRLYLGAKKQIYVKYGWTGLKYDSTDAKKKAEKSLDSVLSADEHEAIGVLVEAHNAAFLLLDLEEHLATAEPPKEFYLQEVNIRLFRAASILETRKDTIRPALRDELTLHMDQIANFVSVREEKIRNFDGNLAKLKNAVADTGEKRQDKDAADRTSNELTDDEKDVVGAIMRSRTYEDEIGRPGIGKAERDEAFKNAQLLVERARWLLRDEKKNIRAGFRERFAPRVEEDARKLERIAVQLERIAKADARLAELKKQNEELEQANRMLEEEQVDLDKWYKRFSGTVKKASGEALADLKTGSPTPTRTHGTSLPPPKSKALQFSDIIAGMDPKKRRARELEDLLREKFASFGGGIEIKLVNNAVGPGQGNRFAAMGEREMEQIKRDLAGLFAAQMLVANPQQRIANELEESYNLEEDDGKDVGLTEKERIANRMMEL